MPRVRPIGGGRRRRRSSWVLHTNCLVSTCTASRSTLCLVSRQDTYCLHLGGPGLFQRVLFCPAGSTAGLFSPVDNLDNLDNHSLSLSRHLGLAFAPVCFPQRGGASRHHLVSRGLKHPAGPKTASPRHFLRIYICPAPDPKSAFDAPGPVHRTGTQRCIKSDNELQGSIAACNSTPI